MNISQYKFLAVVAVLLVFAKESQGNSLASLSQLAKIEKIVYDHKFQEKQEAQIDAGTDEISLDAKVSIKDIQKLSENFPANVASSPAAKIAIEGVLDAVRLIYGVALQANNLFDNALKLVEGEDAEGAIAILQKGVTLERDFIFAVGVRIHEVQGSALSMVGGSALPGLKNAITSIQRAGNAAFETLEVAIEILTAGIKIGGRAAEEAFKSARDIISTGVQSIYKNAKDAAKHALEGVEIALSNTSTNKVNIVSGITDSLKTKISTDNSEALGAISRINDGLKSGLSVLTNKTAIGAANIMCEGLKSTITETAVAISGVKKAIEEAGKLASENVEAAIDLIRKAVKLAQEKIISASAPGYLAMGAAGEMCGKATAEKLVLSVMDNEYSRVTADEYMKLAERTATIGIQGGESAFKKGISTALEICDAAGTAMYQDYKDAAEIGLKAILEIQVA